MYYKTVLFDFDGTLVDTADGIIRSLEYSFTENGKEIPPLSVLQKFIGPPLASSYQNFCGMDDAESEQMIMTFRQRYETKGLFESKVYEGIPELLGWLSDNGVNAGIASFKPQTMLETLLGYFDLKKYFAYTGGTSIENGDDDKASIVRRAAGYFGTDAGDTLMFGDRMYDIDGAHKAGFRCAGAVYGCGTLMELKEHKADYLIEKPADLERVVEAGRL